MKKQFHLGDVLSVAIDRLVSLRHMDGVYDILNFMTGDDLLIHELPRASDECKPYLLKQFPQLKAEELAESLDERLRLQSRDHFSGSLLKVYPYFFLGRSVPCRNTDL